jgi:hypothetical protein
VIIVRITMNALIEKQTEVMQTLLSMIEPMENESGCQSCNVFRDIEDKNVFSLRSGRSHKVIQIQRFAWSKEPFMRTAAN